MEEKTFSIKYKIYYTEELPEQYRGLIEKAREATKYSYAPYSLFRVGAAVRLKNGEIVMGCNQENSVYPVGLCAERVAIFTASTRYPNVPIEAIAIAGFYKNAFTDTCPPCGSCRQALLESECRFNQDIEILLPGRSDIKVFSSVKDLLPLQFSVTNLS